MLNKFERALLINQFEIRKHLEGTDEYDRLIEALVSGYSSYYEGALPEAGNMSGDEQKFVSNILSLFRRIEHYKSDSGDTSVRARFLGFDGNDEGELYGYASFLLRKPNHWEETKRHYDDTDGFNTHFPIRETYSRMLEADKKLGSPYPLTRDHVDVILANTYFSRDSSD